ncbi:MAG: hypothetical protein LBS18_07935, partial [Clostridiales bacterium]|nr:hypothetical protein [Clostridiales bacterium]
MEHFDNLRKMMAGSLGVEEPLYVEGAEFSEEELALHVYVGVRKTAVIACPKCGATTKRNG